MAPIAVIVTTAAIFAQVTANPSQSLGRKDALELPVNGIGFGEPSGGVSQRLRWMTSLAAPENKRKNTHERNPENRKTLQQQIFDLEADEKKLNARSELKRTKINPDLQKHENMLSNPFSERGNSTNSQPYSPAEVSMPNRNPEHGQQNSQQQLFFLQ